MVHGSWLMAHGSWLMVHGSWLMAQTIVQPFGHENRVADSLLLMAHGSGSWVVAYGSRKIRLEENINGLY